MSDTARDYQTIDAAATEGLEDFFEPQASTTCDGLISAVPSGDRFHKTRNELKVALRTSKTSWLSLRARSKYTWSVS
jgi:hypothetical protein